MEDPGLAWPFWKFGLKKDDLFTTLHEQYNTIPSSIQDPEAFHHDVFELSHEASSTAEFHRLMSERKQYRLRELNQSLESASFEIIANPALIGTEQWQYAVQLFRTRSLDSLVRYFASYLPNDHPWHRSASSGSDDSEHLSFLDEKPSILQESLADSALDAAEHQLPLSPRSMAAYSDSSDSSVTSLSDLDHAEFSLTTTRSMSFSESEPDHFPIQDPCPAFHDDFSSQNTSDEEASVASVSDISETHRKEFLAEHEVSIVDPEEEQYLLSQMPQSAEDALESETPTPKPKTEARSAHVSAGGASFFLEAKPSPLSSSELLYEVRRSHSPTRTHLSAHVASTRTTPFTAADFREIQEHQQKQKQTPSPARTRRRDHSPVAKGRRSPANGVVSITSSSGSSSSSSRVQKVSSDPLRSRPRGRRRDDC